jgi:hypothetical protein
MYFVFCTNCTVGTFLNIWLRASTVLAMNIMRQCEILQIWWLLLTFLVNNRFREMFTMSTKIENSFSRKCPQFSYTSMTQTLSRKSLTNFWKNCLKTNILLQSCCEICPSSKVMHFRFSTRHVCECAERTLRSLHHFYIRVLYSSHSPYTSFIWLVDEKRMYIMSLVVHEFCVPRMPLMKLCEILGWKIDFSQMFI